MSSPIEPTPRRTRRVHDRRRVVISGIGGLGHIALQYAREMGLNVAAVDIDDGKLALAKRLGATVTVNAKSTDPVSKERDRRRPRRAGHGRFSECLRASARHGPTGRHHLAQWIAASQLSAADLRHGAERHYGIGARSLAPGSTCRRHLNSPVRERCVLLSPPSGLRTSTTCSRACMPARSTGAWFWICMDRLNS